MIQSTDTVKDKNAFYMLYMEGGNPPKYTHTTYESALKEAERLSNLYRNPIYILRSTEIVMRMPILFALNDKYEEEEKTNLEIIMNELSNQDLIEEDIPPF